MKHVSIGLLFLTILAAAGLGAPATKFERFTLAKDNSRFALSVYEQARKQDGNLIFSPFSISTALGMTYGGARGQTAKDMAKVLRYSLDDADVHSAFAGLLKEVNDNGDDKAGCRLTAANALWGQQGYGFLADFIKRTNDNYGSGLQEVDFRNAPAAVRKTINAWVEKQTDKTIRDLVPEGLLTPNTRLVLTNAIYFKGSWAKQFQKDKTKDDAFHVNGGPDVNVPFMHRTDKYGYYTNPTFQLLEMPYVGEDLTMVILLPREVDGLAVLEKSLNLESMQNWFSRMKTVEVQVSIPEVQDEHRVAIEEGIVGAGPGSDVRG